MADQQPDPYHNFKFQLQIEGQTVAAFSEASLPAQSQAVDFREGVDPNSSRPLSGMTQFGTLSLKRGVTNSLDLYSWYNKTQQEGAGTARKEVLLQLLDESGQSKESWKITGAWPTKYQVTSLQTNAHEVVIELLELELESITLQS